MLNFEFYDTRSLAEFYDTRSLAEFYDTRSLAEFYDTTTEQECFAFYKGIMNNKHLLLGRRLILTTDHLNLTYLVDSESMKVIRWKLGLQQYEMDYVHGQGVLIPVPDYLSRL
jgi:hypothetical protein